MASSIEAVMRKHDEENKTKTLRSLKGGGGDGWVQGRPDAIGTRQAFDVDPKQAISPGLRLGRRGEGQPRLVLQLLQYKEATSGA